MSHHMVWPGQPDSIPCLWIPSGSTGDADVARIPQTTLANLHPRVPFPSCLMVNTATPLPTFAVVVDYSAHTYTVRFFRDLEMWACDTGPYDACIPRLEGRGGRLSSQTTEFTLTGDEHTFAMWDGVPVKI